MKNTILLISLIAGNITAHSLKAQYHVEWSFPTAVSNDESYGNKRPAMALQANGSPAVVWGKNSPDNVYFSKWDKEFFTAPVQLNPAGTTAFIYDWAGPEIASFGDNLYVVYKQMPELTGPIILLRSTDAGNSWEAPVTVDNNPGFITNFPSITINESGNPIITYMVSNTDYTNAQYYTTASSDFGTSFPDATLSSEYSGGEACDCCTATIVSSPDYVATIYRDNLSNVRNVWTGISTDGGITFAEGMQVDETNWNIFACPSSGPTGFIWEDNLYTSWMSASSGESLIYTSVSSLSTLTDSEDIEVTGLTDNLNGQNAPRMTHYENAACLIWRQTDFDFHSQLMLQFSEDLDEGWGEVDTLWDQDNYGIIQGDVAMSDEDIHIIWQDNNAGKIYYAFGSYLEEETGVQNNEPAQQLITFPQPADNNLFVNNFEGSINSIALISINGGRILPDYSLDHNQIILQTQKIPAGFYVLEIVNASGLMFRSNCIIQHD